MTDDPSADDDDASVASPISPSRIEQRDPATLDPHSRSQDIYGETDPPPEFVDRIREHGVLEPLVVTPEGTIISGHRRTAAAEAANLDTVPVIERTYEDDFAEWEAIVLHNRHRRKTPGQIVREAETLMEVEKERAKRRKQATLSPGDDSDDDNDSDDDADESNTTTDDDETGDSPEWENFPGQGRARETVAEKLNADVSGRTLEKGLRVKEAAEDADAAEELGLDPDAAADAMEQLDSGEESFHGAYETAQGDDADDEASEGDAADDDAAADLGPPRYECSVCGEEWVEYRDALAAREGDTIDAVEKVCIATWPDDIVLHISEEELE